MWYRVLELSQYKACGGWAVMWWWWKIPYVSIQYWLSKLVVYSQRTKEISRKTSTFILESHICTNQTSLNVHQLLGWIAECDQFVVGNMFINIKTQLVINLTDMLRFNIASCVVVILCIKSTLSIVLLQENFLVLNASCFQNRTVTFRKLHVQICTKNILFYCKPPKRIFSVN